MKFRQAIKTAVRWSRGDEARAKEIFMAQVSLDPKLKEQFEDEASAAYVEELIYEFLAKGYSLDRPDELIAAVGARLKRGPEQPQ